MSGKKGQGSGADSYMDAATQLLALATQQPATLDTQRAAFERAVEAGGTEREAVVDALLDAVGLPTFFDVNADDADGFISQLTALEQQWNHLSLRWNREDTEGDALNTSPLMPLMAMVAADASRCDLELWILQRLGTDGSEGNTWSGWLAPSKQRKAVQACVDALALPAYPWSSRPTLLSSVKESPSPNKPQRSEAGSSKFPFHAGLKKLAHECREWMKHAESKGKLEDFTSELQGVLDKPGVLDAKVAVVAQRLGHYFEIAACDAYFRSDLIDFTRLFASTVQFRGLLLRFRGAICEMHPTLVGWPKLFQDSLSAASVVMTSDWSQGAVCAARYLHMVDQDQRLAGTSSERQIALGTVDAFLVMLLSQAFDITTSFQPVKPMIAEYSALLEAWRSEDKEVFLSAMSDAATFHLSRSKHSTDRTDYEFNSFFDRLFAPELLAIQALRQRDGLPACDTGHLVVDGPWSVVATLPKTDPHPLVTALEARMRHDYPTFQ